LFDRYGLEIRRLEVWLCRLWSAGEVWEGHTIVTHRSNELSGKTKGRENVESFVHDGLGRAVRRKAPHFGYGLEVGDHDLLEIFVVNDVVLSHGWV
jgi:hypothetical protein